MTNNTGPKHTRTQVLTAEHICGLAQNSRYLSFSDDFDFAYHSAATVRLSANCEKIVDLNNPLYHTITTMNDNRKFGLWGSACRFGLPDAAKSSFAGVRFMYF